MPTTYGDVILMVFEKPLAACGDMTTDAQSAVGASTQNFMLLRISDIKSVCGRLTEIPFTCTERSFPVHIECYCK